MTNLRKLFTEEDIMYCKNKMENHYKSIFESIPNSVLNEYYFITKMLQHNSFGYIYFLYNEDTKLTKIGYSSDLKQRFTQIKQLYQNYVGLNPKLKLVGVIYLNGFLLSKIESTIHDFYKKERKYGEWFSLDLGQIIQDWFLTGKFTVIDGVYTIVGEEFEYEHFEFIDKNYNFNENELLSFIKIVYSIDDSEINDCFSSLLNHYKPNKLFQIYDICSKQLGLTCSGFRTNENCDSFIETIYTLGLEGCNYKSIQSIKEENFNPDDIKNALLILN